MGRNMSMVINDDQGEERASFKLGYGTKVMVEEGQTVNAWRPPVRVGPLHAADHRRKGGHGEIRRPDLGRVVREETDDATGMTQKIVSDWRAAPKGNELKPEIIIVGEDGEPVRNEQGNPVTYPMSVDAILSVEDGQRSRPATWWRGSRAKAPRPRTSPAVCRGWPNCSRRGVPRTTRSSPKSTAT
jgi:DNA-directed RNA polymerase subunit beta'